MIVYLLYDFGDLVGIYASPEAAAEDEAYVRKTSIWAVDHDSGVELIEYEVKQ